MAQDQGGQHEPGNDRADRGDQGTRKRRRVEGDNPTRAVNESSYSLGVLPLPQHPHVLTRVLISEGLLQLIEEDPPVWTVPDDGENPCRRDGRNSVFYYYNISTQSILKRCFILSYYLESIIGLSYISLQIFTSACASADL